MNADEHGSGSAPKNSFAGSFGFALLMQSLVCLLASLVLDGGGASRVAMIAAIAFWPCAFAMLLVRRGRLSAADHVMVRHGYWLSLGVTAVVLAIQ